MRKGGLKVSGGKIGNFINLIGNEVVFESSEILAKGVVVMKKR